MSQFIWTNHAIQRLKDRRVPDGFADQTLFSPDTIQNQPDGTIKYQKKSGHQTSTAIIKKNDRGENIVVSFWVDPPNFGTQDFKKRQNYLEMKKSSGLRKMWLILKKQLGF